MLPLEFYYVDSWLNRELDIFYQLMKTADTQLFSAWTRQLSDLVEFDIVHMDGPPQRQKNALQGQLRHLVFPQKNGHAPSANSFEFYRAPVTKATVKAVVVIEAINIVPDLAS